MTDATRPTTQAYDSAAPRWGDKMRALGYYDAYRGFLTAGAPDPAAGKSVIDIGAGTAAFAQAFIVAHGRPESVVLLDPSREMLNRGQRALRGQGVVAKTVCATLDDANHAPSDIALAAHVLEHCPDPFVALTQMRDLLRPGGRLYLVVSKPHWCNAIIWFQWRHRTFARDEILDLVTTAGFSVERENRFPSGPPSRTSRGIVATRLDP